MRQIHETTNQTGTAQTAESVRNQFEVTGNRMMERLREILREGNIRSVVIRHNGQVVARLPLTVSVIATVLVPWLAAVGLVTVLLTESSIEIEKSGQAPPQGPTAR